MNKEDKLGKIFFIWKVIKPEFLIWNLTNIIKDYKINVDLEDIGILKLNLHPKYGNLRFMIKFYPTILFVTNEGLRKLENNISLDSDDIEMFGSKLEHGSVVRMRNNELIHINNRKVGNDEILIYEGLVASSSGTNMFYCNEGGFLEWLKYLNLITQKL